LGYNGFQRHEADGHAITQGRPLEEQATFDDDKFFRNLFVQLCSQPADALESEFLEIKGWCKDEKELTEKLADAASCLANHEGGVVLVGIGEGSKNQRFSRCPFANLSPKWLVARVQDHTHPPVECEGLDLTSVLAEVLGTGDAHVYALQVQRNKCVSGHANSKGISRVRSGKECKPQFISEDDRTKMIVPDATLDDLSLGSIQWAIGQHSRHFSTPETFADCWDFLDRSGLLLPEGGSGRVTLAALLLFGKDAAFARRSVGCETVIDIHGEHRTVRKNIVESLRETILSERAVLRVALPSIPDKTLRELVVNAYVHRCWRTNGPVTITVSDTALDIQNPGDLLGGLSVGNLLYGVPVYRNFLLAEGMRFSGLSDKIGQGIDLVFKSVLSGGFDFPVFESSNGTFRASVPLARSEEFREFVRRRSASLSQLDELVVLRYLWGASEADFKQLSDALQRGRDIARRVVQAMEKKQMVEVVDGRFCLTRALRLDIETSFNADQMSLELSGSA
jgi:ATP-dependent DNA helicase RecG